MQEFKGLIDIHSHILPGVDDGAADLNVTKKMLTIAYEQGIRTIIATPHYSWQSKQSTDHLIKQLELVQEEAKRIDSDFRIYLGNEIYYEDGCLTALRQKKALTLAGSRYVLVEFSIDVAYTKIYQSMQEFILGGYIPIIAHIERYAALRKNEERIEELGKLGCYLQVNATSLLGGVFDSEAAFLRRLVIQSKVHFIATDSHDARVRSPRFDQLIKKLLKSMDEEDINQVLCVNPSMVLSNQYI